MPTGLTSLLSQAQLRDLFKYVTTLGTRNQVQSEAQPEKKQG